MEWPCWCASHFRDRWAIQNTSLDWWICWDLYYLQYIIYWWFWYPIIWERKAWSKVGILAGSKITDFKHIMMLYAIVILHHHVQHKFIYFCWCNKNSYTYAPQYLRKCSKYGLLVLHPFLVEAEQSVEPKHGPTEVTLGIIALSKDFWCSWESNGMFLEMLLLQQHHCAGEIGCCPLPSWNGFTPVISGAGSEGCSSSPSSKAHRCPNDMMSC